MSFLHYLLPSWVARCTQQCRNGFALLIPVQDNANKYTVKLNCGHKMTDDMRSAVKRYYSGRRQEAHSHRQACLKTLEERKPEKQDKGGIA